MENYEGLPVEQLINKLKDKDNLLLAKEQELTAKMGEIQAMKDNQDGMQTVPGLFEMLKGLSKEEKQELLLKFRSTSDGYNVYVGLMYGV